MFAARDQENLAASHQHGAVLKQQQNHANRQLGQKTPGPKFSKTPMKVPLNDENGARMTSKAFKGGDKSSFVTPKAQGARAVLGDKTTNAKAKAQQTVNVKSAVKEIEKSQVKPQTTIRPGRRELLAETQKLEVHAEEADPLSEDEIEYCPPRPKDLPYKSDVFPDGVLTFDALKPENLMKGYYQYYFNPIDENGVSRRDKELAEETRKSIEEGERKIKEDLDNFEWSVTAELKEEPAAKSIKKAPATTTKLPAYRKPLSTIRSKNAADVLSMDDTTRSMQRKAAKTPEFTRPQRKAAKTPEFTRPQHKKSSSFALPGLRTSSRPASSQLPSAPKRPAAGLEAMSRTTIGYNKGRATAAALLTKTGTTKTLSGQPGNTARAPASTSTYTQRGGMVRSNTTLSNDSDKTITPARYAHKHASQAEDDEHSAWRERVPFLSIFNNPDNGGDVDEEEDDDPLCIKNRTPMFPEDDDEEEEFELKLAD
ncbi:hypothetical protein F4777DRAFT_180496 [Nemania sp. FL0916]|nr:hypothetical protein F4777DRAFT_180496 [Nemania sp. FL0916]